MKAYLFVFYFMLFSSAVFAQQKCDSLVLSVPADTFQFMLGKHDGTIIDVRSKKEFDTGYIKGAVNIDYRSPDFQKRILTLDKSKTYYVYCEIGGRSAMAAEYMKSQGFCKIIILKRGIRNWTEMGFPVVVPKSRH